MDNKFNQRLREFENDQVRNQTIKDLQSKHNQPPPSRRKSIKQMLIGVFFAIILSLIDYLIKRLEPQGGLRQFLVIFFFMSAIGAAQIGFGAYSFINSFSINKNR
ncbi:hypothetical protein [Alkaliphilus transvaalensis]|uniref:hypothetical protein n=1 Tax=Alkaliphilus transvaalensis TaxID=114628 RepID=UPI000479764D|nr:hypothetical protein [Alkaliphilus transvaalensis]